MTKSGFTNKFKTDKTTATIIAVKYESTWTPFKTLAKTITAIAFNKRRIISFMIEDFKY